MRSLGHQQRRRTTLRVHRLHRLHRQRHIEDTLWNAGRTRALKLRDDAAHEAVIRMAGSSIRTPRDHGTGLQTPQLFGDALADSIDQRRITGVVAELAVRETEKDRRLCDDNSIAMVNIPAAARYARALSEVAIHLAQRP
jgi:hypothetical protein